METPEFTAHVVIGILICVTIVLFVLYSGLRQNKKFMEQQREIMAADHEKQKQILLAVMATEEKEKVRLSTELHDSVGPSLSMIKLDLGRQVSSNQITPAVRNELECTVQSLDGIIETFRTICYQLYPAALIRYGLLAVLRDMLNAWMHSAPVTARLKTELSEGELGNEVDFKLSIFRIMQEILNNIMKHAKPQNLTCFVLKCNEGDRLLITIQHDGSVFTNEMALQKINTGIGLCSIASRLDMLEGTLDYGTEKDAQMIRLKIPLTQ